MEDRDIFWDAELFGGEPGHDRDQLTRPAGDEGCGGLRLEEESVKMFVEVGGRTFIVGEIEVLLFTKKSKLICQKLYVN